jgi:uncharacterized protein YndB with AHSA1/START domain
VGDYSIRMQFDVDAPGEAVWAALTTEDGVRAWWTNHVTLTDGRLESSFPDVPQPFEFAVRTTDADRVEWETGAFPPWWAGTTVRWQVSRNPDGAGTRLAFEHGGYDPDNPVIPIVTPAWAQIVLRLKDYAESGRPNPFFAF